MKGAYPRQFELQPNIRLMLPVSSNMSAAVMEERFRSDARLTEPGTAGSRAKLHQDGARGSQSASPYWIAAVPAVVMAVLIVGILFIANPLRRAPVNSEPPATQSPFACATSSPISSSTAPAVAYINDVRTGTNSGYDRLTVEFTGLRRLGSPCRRRGE